MKKYIIIHHSGVSRETQPNQFYAINNWHKQKWGMKSRTGYYHGYTHYLGTNGIITKTRELDEEGAHTLGYNKGGHIAICVAGDFDKELPNQKQLKALNEFIDSYPDREVKLHRELNNNRNCPGNLLTEKLFNKNIITKNEDIIDIEKAREIQAQINLITKLMETLKDLLYKLSTLSTGY